MILLTILQLGIPKSIELTYRNRIQILNYTDDWMQHAQGGILVPVCNNHIITKKFIQSTLYYFNKCNNWKHCIIHFQDDCFAISTQLVKTLHITSKDFTPINSLINKIIYSKDRQDDITLYLRETSELWGNSINEHIDNLNIINVANELSRCFYPHCDEDNDCLDEKQTKPVKSLKLVKRIKTNRIIQNAKDSPKVISPKESAISPKQIITHKPITRQLRKVELRTCLSNNTNALYNKMKTPVDNLLNIAIPIVNRWDLLERCLNSIDFPVNKVIIVDNSFSEYIRQHVKAFTQNDHPYINEFILIDKRMNNLGFAGSLNYVMQCFPMDWWFFCNNDVIFGKGDLYKIATYLMSTKTSPPYICKCWQWCACIIKKPLIDAIGFLDETFYPSYFEDTDYQLRAAIWGYNNNIEVIGSIDNLNIKHGDKNPKSLENASKHNYGGANHVRIDNHVQQVFQKHITANRKYFIQKWNIKDFYDDYKVLPDKFKHLTMERHMMHWNPEFAQQKRKQILQQHLEDDIFIRGMNKIKT
uniref:Glycosyltransferase 2-like domain-containing protein n=1 Tax=Megaviridae environmental sample TaxID=1737588 RepID=A0A5J6VJM5_9VIRU|nr:MAG: hypothetical protein [Megaviridae environmental sample]